LKLARESIPFIVIPAVLGVLSLVFGFWYLTIIFALVVAFMAYFFRDPRRVPPQDPNVVVAPADGRVTRIKTLASDNGDSSTFVSIFLSPFDVHINRAPITGRITRSLYVPGTFLNAALDKASEDNERRIIVIETPADGEIGVVQIAGLVARRIVTFSAIGETIGVGQRFGLIRFGSRVDVYLPPGKGALVSVGQRAVAGETVLADLQSLEPEREALRG